MINVYQNFNAPLTHDWQDLVDMLLAHSLTSVPILLAADFEKLLKLWFSCLQPLSTSFVFAFPKITSIIYRSSFEIYIYDFRVHDSL